MVLWSLCVLSRPSDCLVCSAAIPATVFPSCLCGLTVLVSRKAFWLVVGSVGLHIQKKKSWVSGRKGSGRSNHNRGQEGVDVQILFGIECVDEVALQAISS